MRTAKRKSTPPGSCSYARPAVVGLWLAVNCCLYSQTAHAYLDPGTGSILLQSIIAGIAAGIGICRLYWNRVTGFFRGTERPADESDAKPEQDVRPGPEV